MTESETYTRLKYPMPTRDENTWDLCAEFPLEILRKWAWRCAEDAENSVELSPIDIRRIDSVRKYHSGEMTYFIMCGYFLQAPDTSSEWTSWSFYWTAFDVSYTNAQYYYMSTVKCAANATTSWDKYIGWLAENMVTYDSGIVDVPSTI